MVNLTADQWAVWDRNRPMEPIDHDGMPAIFDTRGEAQRVAKAKREAGDTRTLIVRPYVEHHVGSVFPGTVKITFVPPTN